MMINEYIKEQMKLAKEIYSSGNNTSKIRDKCDDEFCRQVSEEEFNKFKKDNNLMLILGAHSPFFGSGELVDFDINKLK